VSGKRLAAIAGLALLALLPAIDVVIPQAWHLSPLLPRIFAYTIIGLGLNVVTGFTGLLNLGAAAFIAVGAYAYSILTCDIYPFRIGFWPGLAAAATISAAVGALLALPTMRLRGDYLAIVTLGFGEIIQDLLKNLEPITKGTTGINPVPHPWLPGLAFGDDPGRLSYYYLYLALAALAALLCLNLRRSRIGREWVAVREDELAARSCGINAARVKLSAFAWSAGLCGAGGALYAALIGLAVPSDYEFQTSIIVLCAVIVGGMGSVPGVLVGSLVMFGFNEVVLTTLTRVIGDAATGNVLRSPTNWKYLVFGLALILAMRFRPEGILPAREVRAELHRGPTPRGPGKAV
jgi:branched-chain amino acid transport system permease protein